MLVVTANLHQSGPAETQLKRKQREREIENYKGWSSIVFIIMNADFLLGSGIILIYTGGQAVDFIWRGRSELKIYVGCCYSASVCVNC